MNTTDMDFARDKHDWYGKISSVLLSTHAHMFVLQVKVQYTIIIIIIGFMLAEGWSAKNYKNNAKSNNDN